MRYFKDTNQTEPFWGCMVFAFEVNDDDFVKREVGMDVDGRVIHKSPSEVHRHGRKGAWTNMWNSDVTQTLADGAATPITETDFEALWNDPAPPPPEHQRRRGWRHILDNL